MAKGNKQFKLKFHFGKLSAILIAVLAVLITTDLVLKYCEEKFKWVFTVIPKLIWVEYGGRNTGAAFSFLASTEWGRIFFIILTFIMVFAMVFAFILLPERFVGLKIAITLIVSGAIGNLVDRLAFAYVRDFVWVNIFGTPAHCNFADFWIVFGVIIAIIDILFINEWAIFPLTKRAKAAQKQRSEEAKQEEEQLRASQPTDPATPELEEGATPDGNGDISATQPADGTDTADNPDDPDNTATQPTDKEDGEE